jgi:hypothetical protein
MIGIPLPQTMSALLEVRWLFVSFASFFTSQCLTAALISRVSGTTLVTNYYGGSLLKLLRAMYPDHAWDPQRFSRSSSVS